MHSRKRVLRIVLVAACALTSALVTGDEKSSRIKKVSAEKASEYRAEFSGYEGWGSITPKPMPTKMLELCASRIDALDAANPHANGFVHVYVNPVGRQAYLAAKPPQFAVGTVIVKAKLLEADDEKPHELGIMIKRPKGFDPAAGDWQYLFVEQDGEIVDDAESMSSCRDCHQHRAAKGYVFQKHLRLPRSPNAKASLEPKRGS